MAEHLLTFCPLEICSYSPQNILITLLGVSSSGLISASNKLMQHCGISGERDLSYDIAWITITVIPMRYYLLNCRDILIRMVTKVRLEIDIYKKSIMSMWHHHYKSPIPKSLPNQITQSTAVQLLQLWNRNCMWWKLLDALYTYQLSNQPAFQVEYSFSVSQQ